MYILFLFVYILIAFFYSVKRKDIMHPLLIYILPIFIQYCIYAFVYSDYYPVRNNVFYVHAVFIFTYFFSYMIGENFFYRKFKKYNVETKIIVKKRVYPFFAAITFIALLSIILDINRLVHSFSLTTMYREMLYHIDFGEGYSFCATYFPILFEVLYVIYIYNNYSKLNIKNYKFVFLTFLLIMFLIATFTRTTIMFMVLACAYCYLNRKKNDFFSNPIKTLKTLSIILLCVLCLFIIFSWIANQTDRLGSSKIFSRDFFLWQYFALSFPTLDAYVIDNGGISHGYYFFGFLGKYLLKYKVISDAFFKIKPSINTFNVFMYMGNWYFDFGNYAFFFQFIVGILISYVYVKNLCFGNYWTIFYAFYSYALFMSFYAAQYSLTLFAYIVVCFFIIKFFNRFKFYKKSKTTQIKYN